MDALPRWDVSTLPVTDWSALTARAEALRAHWNGRIYNGHSAIAAADLLEVLKAYESLLRDADKGRRAAQIAEHADHSAYHDYDKDAKAGYNAVDQATRFIKTELTAMPEALRAPLLKDPLLARYAPWIGHIVHTDRVDADAADVQALNDTVLASHAAPYDDLSDANAAHVAALIDAAMTRQTAIARQKNYRGEQTGIAALDMSLGHHHIDPMMLQALEQSAAQTLSAYGRYFDKKAGVVAGEQPMTIAQALEPLPGAAAPISWEDAKARVIAFYETLGLGDQARRLFDEGRIDAQPDRPGKNGTDQVIPLNGTAHVLVHFRGDWASLSTLAHEVGHAIHFDASNSPDALYNRPFAMPVPHIETVALFSERAFYEHQKQYCKSPAELTRLTADYIQNRSFFAAQALTYHAFEKALYARKQAGETLTPAILDAEWKQAAAHYYGSRVDLNDPAFTREWIKSFPRDYLVDQTAFYSYSYPLAATLADALYQEYRKAPASFRERYGAMLKDGQNQPLDKLMQSFGIDSTDPKILKHNAAETQQMIESLDLSALKPPAAQEKETRWQNRIPMRAQPATHQDLGTMPQSWAAMVSQPVAARTL